MGWGTAIAKAWNAASATGKAAAQQVASSASAAYDFTKDVAVQGYNTAKDAAVQGYNAAKDAAVQGYNAAKSAAARARDEAIRQAQAAKQAAIDGARAKVDTASRAVIEARYAQALGPVGTAKYAYAKAREGLGLNPAGGPVQSCPCARKECRDLDDALNKAKLADDTYNDTPGALPGGYQRLDPDRDRAELSALLDTDNPRRKLEPDGSDFKARVYKRVVDGRTEYVMGFRGTQTGNDWKENLLQGAGQFGPGQSTPSPNRSYERAMELASTMSKKAGERGAGLSYAGHSLGGGMASAAAAVTGNPASTFNAAGLNANTLGGSYPKPPAPVDAYFTPTDILNAAQDNRGVLLGGITAAVSTIPLVGPMGAAALAGWLGGNEVAGTPVMPKAYGTRHPLPFPSGRQPPLPTPAGIIEGHGMDLVVAGIKEQQRLSGCS